MNTTLRSPAGARLPALLMLAANLAWAAPSQAQTQATGSSAATSYSRVIAFGDSLSDNGNFYRATGGAVPQPGNYFQGRFSNGQVAVEHLAQGLGVSLQDYAWGGAQTGWLNGAAVAAGAPAALQNTGMLSQVGAFQSGLAGSAADSQALYVLWGGANDFQYLGFSQATAQAAIQNLSSAVQTLYGLGARNFLMPGLPNLGQTPAGLSSGLSGQLHQLSLGFNFGLNQAIGQLRTLTGIDIRYFDTLGTQQTLVDNAALYGFSNVTQACFTGYVGQPDGSTCSSPESYMYWDRIHPTTLTHGYLGQGMLAAVPEPQTWLLMGLGLAALGLRAGRQRRS
ncbi:SGNH/GDSL hydrolase family protein [Kinneretia aquatilis]|uniref:SGNH/GDSL hydrolase family protein n=1 Tax=Kinneretia aquatilis TaxID=2070761 RepID=UPI00149513FB|nr:SGNH/GDSL hydrolase family protein [Paucibacter aquatile]WIV97636.1 SGNH/GDSL hydrolase family protein [Paucibacter aquatile]